MVSGFLKIDANYFYGTNPLKLGFSSVLNSYVFIENHIQFFDFH